MEDGEFVTDELEAREWTCGKDLLPNGQVQTLIKKYDKKVLLRKQEEMMGVNLHYRAGALRNVTDPSQLH